MCWSPSLWLFSHFSLWLSVQALGKKSRIAQECAKLNDLCIQPLFSFWCGLWFCRVSRSLRCTRISSPLSKCLFVLSFLVPESVLIFCHIFHASNLWLLRPSTFFSIDRLLLVTHSVSCLPSSYFLYWNTWPQRDDASRVHPATELEKGDDVIFSYLLIIP